jgi:Domain of unknown function (DUF6391)
MNVLDDIPVISTVRRNHGLEHATIHVLTSRHARLSMVGHATVSGFNLYGEVETADVESAANEALERIRAGESRLVIHPNCGTNFATAGMVAGLAAWVASMGSSRASKLPRMMLASTVGLLFAMPLGLSVQEHITTSAVVGSAAILGVTRGRRGNLTMHSVKIG